MKKFICLIILSVLFRVGHAQISGVKTIPGDYPDIRSAITALNASGVGSGGVTFNVAAGYTETFTSLTAGLITATGTASNPIVFQKSGSGPNPVITAPTPGVGTTDYVICLAGSDYVTFDGINIVENSLNTTATKMMERGFALLKNSGTDGCQYVTIKNCTIRLKGTNTSSYGIYTDNATPAAPGTQLTVTADAGTNSNIKIHNDSITQCGNGIFFAGCSGYFDQDNRIGADGANVLADLGTTTGTVYGINVKYQNNLTVSQNTMNGTVRTKYYGIYTGPGDNASFEISNNTVSVYNVADTANMFGIYNTMGSNGTTNMVNISYNNISGNNLPNNSTGSFTGIDNESKCFHLNCSYNNINDNIIGASSSRSEGTFFGIYNTASTNVGGSTWDFGHNTLSGNTRPVGSAYGGSNYYVFCNGGALTTNFYSNLINNNSSNTVANSYLLYYVNAGSTFNMYSNQLTNFTSAGGGVFGAYLGAHFTGNIHDNMIENIVSSGSYSNGNIPSVHGLFVGPSVNLENIYNNIIGDLNAPNSNFRFSVVALQTFSAYKLYNNTLYLNGVGTSQVYGIYLIDDESLSGPLDMRNNILINTCIPLGTGASYILYRGASGNINDFAATTNNNNLYMGEWSPQKYFIAGGVFANNIQDYKAVMYPRETSAFSENTSFINTSSHPYNLHINASVATQCESGAQVISTPFPVNQDIDGEVRYPNSGYPNNYSHPATAPDAGADEFGGINVDIVPPVISCTPLSNTFVTNPQTLTATITDVSGVPVSGNGLPVVYWKKNTNGSWNTVAGVPGSNNQYSFTLGGGVTLGDSIFYYIAAQDNAPAHNVGAFPGYGSGAFSSNPPYSQVPVTPMMYRIWNSDSISGIIPVGVGQTYTTLTDALNDISTKVFVGPVILELHDTTYPAETFPLSIEPSDGMSAINTLTIRPYAGVITHFTGNSSSGILKINGAKYVIIDGSNCNGTDRSLSWINTNTSSFSVGFYNKNGEGASHCVIKNCIIKASTQMMNGTIGLSFDSNGGAYCDNVIDNNQICSARFGIWCRGGSSGLSRRNKFTHNIIGSRNTADEITYRGISLMSVDSTLIEHNDIFNDSVGNANFGQAGVYIFSGSTHTRILSNRIHDLVYTSGSSNNYGIYYASDASTVTEICNNLFYNIVSKTKPFCIWIGTGGNIHLYHNTFYLSGNNMSGTSTTYSACININNNITLLDIQDNIFKNSAQPITPNPNITSYAIYNNGATSVFSNLDHNDYYIDGPNPTIGYQGGAQQSLAQWQTATSRDYSSLVMDPVFNSPTGLVPTKDSLNNKGYYLTTVSRDFNDSLRSNPPDQGALNFGVDPYVVTDSATNVLYNSAILNGMVNAHGVNTTITFDYGTTSAYGSTINATPNTLNTMTNTPVSANLGGLSYMTTYHFRAHGVTPDGVNFYGRDFTFTTPAAPPVVVTLPATNVTGTSVMLHGTANASGSTTSVVFEYGPTTSYGSTISSVPASIFDTVTNSEVVTLTGLLPNATYHYRIRGVNAGGTSYGTDMMFNTPAILPVVVTNLPTYIGSDFAQLNGTVMANNALTNVFFQYGLTTAYGTTIAASPAALSGMTPNPEVANLSSLLINTTYHYRCVGTSIAGTAYGQDQVFTTNCIPPVISISGPVSACTGVSGYIYTTQTGNFNYEWNISAGGTITSGLGTSSITVTWDSAGPQTVSVNYSNQFNCSLSIPVEYNVTVFSNPTPTVTGPSTSCQYSTTNTYSTEAGMSNYVWTLSQGGTITSGSGTSSIVVTWNNPGAQTVSVNYNNASGCNASTPTTLNVTVDTLPAPTISGPSDICANSGNILYTTETGMTSYLWTISAGGTIVSGQGTPAVQVSWNQSGSQTISVNYANSFGCSAMSPTVYTVTVNAAPGAAGTITGITTVCGGTTGVAYSCAPITNAAYYVWTLPSGATIASGSGTNTITVDYAANASSGDITVYGNNLCGNGTTSPALTVTVTSLPETPGNITGPANVCQGESGIVYSVEPITGATTYTWTVPTGAAIVSGNNTYSITVDFSAAASTGAITVFAGNSCGNGPVSSMTVTVNPIPAAPVITLLGTALHSDVANGNQWYLDGTLIVGATSQDYDPVATGTYWDVVTTNNCQSDTSNHIYYIILGINDQHSTGFSIYPVPNDGNFTVSIFSPSLQSFTLRIYSNIGVEVYQSGPFDVNGTVLKPIDLEAVSSGLYTVIVYTADNKIAKKFLVNK